MNIDKTQRLLSRSLMSTSSGLTPASTRFWTESGFLSIVLRKKESVTYFFFFFLVLKSQVHFKNCDAQDTTIVKECRVHECGVPSCQAP